MKPILEDALEGVFISDAEGNVIALDRACERLFGYKAAEIAGKPAAILFPAEEPGSADVHLVEHLPGGGIRWSGHRRSAHRKDGTIFPAEFSIIHTRTSVGDSLFVGVIHDINRGTRFTAA